MYNAVEAADLNIVLQGNVVEERKYKLRVGIKVSEHGVDMRLVSSVFILNLEQC